MSGYVNPVFRPDVTDYGMPPQNQLAPQPTWADAATYNAQAMGDYIAQQRAKSEQMGLWDPNTGLPTGAGVVNAAQQTGNALLMGTTAPGIRAFHGSPYDFERFDTSKIGTGEGAQAYGHGLYFAEGEGTARSYRDALTADRGPTADWIDNQGNKLDMDALRGGTGPKADAAAMLSQRGSVDEAIKDIKDWGPSTFIGGQKDMDSVLSALQELKDAGLSKQVNRGHMYEVNIGADPERFLHWDKPISEQSPQMQDLLDKSGIARRENQPYITGQDVHDFLSTKGDYAAGAQRLKDLGIPGIRYLDQGSRGAGEGTHNYVVFDANTIDILRKYGLAGLGVGLSGAAAGTQQQSQ